MSLASDTRDAVDREPFLHAALAAGVVNYTAAARYLDLGDEEPVAAALRRYADELASPTYDTDARVEMQSGIGIVDDGDALLSVGDNEYGPSGGDLTALLAIGDIDAGAVGQVLSRLAIEDIPLRAAGVSGDIVVCVVDRAAGVDALRYVEETLET